MESKQQGQPMQVAADPQQDGEPGWSLDPVLQKILETHPPRMLAEDEYAGYFVRAAEWMLPRARRRVRDQSVAEDVVQETLVVGWPQRDRFPMTNQLLELERFLSRILSNKIIDYFRAQTSSAKWTEVFLDAPRVTDDDSGDTCGDHQADQTAGADELVECFDTTARVIQYFIRRFLPHLDNLTARERQLVTMRYLDELTPAQIAVELKNKPASIRTQLSRAVSKVRETIVTLPPAELAELRDLLDVSLAAVVDES